MRPRHRRIDTDIPTDPTSGVGHRLQHHQQHLPGAIALPLPENPEGLSLASWQRKLNEHINAPLVSEVEPIPSNDIALCD